MEWKLPNDRTKSVITAESHIDSDHGNTNEMNLPEICVIFEIGMAIKYIENNFKTITLIDRLPCFLDNPKCITVCGHENVCFTKGGYGAPAATDTLETLIALGVKKIIVVGMCGVYAENINVGDVIIPRKILCEEGTSHHYHKNIEFAAPNKSLHTQAVDYFKSKFTTTTSPTVTSDGLYRQTFAKEKYWREQSCVGVDMEASALLSVSKYHSIPAVAILLASDKHPLDEKQTDWSWGTTNFKLIREKYVTEAVKFALQITE